MAEDDWKKGVTPLGQKKAPKLHPASKQKPNKADLRAHAEGSPTRHTPQSELHAECTISHAKSPNHQKTLSAMASGHLQASAWLDLHGMTVEQAQRQVDDFIKQQRQRGTRVIGIIHGKGLRSDSGAVLKNAVVTWLAAHPNVCAYQSAPTHDGGRGAVLVRLV